MCDVAVFSESEMSVNSGHPMLFLKKLPQRVIVL